MPATTSRPRSAQNPFTVDAASNASPQPPMPMTSTSRSPKRSVAKPHGTRVSTEPASEAEISTPVSPSERP